MPTDELDYWTVEHLFVISQAALEINPLVLCHCYPNLGLLKRTLKRMLRYMLESKTSRN